MFGAGLRENIAYGREDAPIEDVIRVAKIAQLDDFISALDDSYETEVGERGVNLSGGQRQRMSIARAVLLDPPILVLDDSTSSVDANTEDLIRRAMEEVMKGRTDADNRAQAEHGAQGGRDYRAGGGRDCGAWDAPGASRAGRQV